MRFTDYPRSLSLLLSLLLVLALALLSTGCGANRGSGTSTSSSGGSTPNAPTVSLTSSPAAISAGSSSTLTVTATNATNVTLTGSDGSSYILGPTGGTAAVNPTVTTTYTATATGAGGTATATTLVTVGQAVTAPAVTVAASPASITAGNTSTLTVTATNATAVTLTGSDGSSYTLGATGGTETVSPAVTTTYTATATGAGGTVTATALITVGQAATPPTVTVAASPASITAGSTSTLTVTATNSTAVTLTGSDGSSYNLGATGGTKTVSPIATTTYTATATGAGGTATATAVVTVALAASAPTVTISANPTSVSAGASSTLTVIAANASTVTLTGSDGSSYTLGAMGGTETVSPTATTTYTATATGAGATATAAATVTVTQLNSQVTIAASPTTIHSGASSTLTVSASNATGVKITGSDGSSYTLGASGGTQSVSPTSTTTYTAVTAVAGASATATATVTVTVLGPSSVDAVDHVILMMQENHSFDNYFGMLNPYRHANGWNVGDDGMDYEVDGIDDKLYTLSNTSDSGTVYYPFKLTSSCVDDESSDWLASYGDVNTYNFLANRPILNDGFVHNAAGYESSGCSTEDCTGGDTAGERAMGYYDQGFLNYYYYMASQFAISDRWFSPISSKTVDNRIATLSGGTTQGLVQDPGDDRLSQLDIPTIFEELDKAGVSWKLYYTVTEGYCLDEDDCSATASARYPATFLSSFDYSYNFLYENPSGASCIGTTQPSSVVGDSTNSFCIDPNHLAPLSYFYSDLANGTLPSFAFIEPGYGMNDEHPGSQQSILTGQAEVAKIINAFMASSSWKDSVFFLAYDEGGGPYDHVPPVPNYSNVNTDASLGTIPDISSISVNADSYEPCLPTGGTPTTHCDLNSDDPGAHTDDAPAVSGFKAQLGFRVPNMVISPFTRKHYVSHIPMDHTAIIKFVENRFIGPTAHLTARDAAQPNLLNFFDFDNVPWLTPPAPPTPATDQSLGKSTCHPANLSH